MTGDLLESKIRIIALVRQETRPVREQEPVQPAGVTDGSDSKRRIRRLLPYVRMVYRPSDAVSTFPRMGECALVTVGPTGTGTSQLVRV